MAAAMQMPSGARLEICRRVEADAVEALKASVRRRDRLRFELQQQAFELQARGADVINDGNASRGLALLRGDLAGAEMSLAYCANALETARRAVSDAEREEQHGPSRERASLERVVRDVRPLVVGFFDGDAESSLQRSVGVLRDANNALASLHSNRVDLDVFPVDSTPVVGLIAAECLRRGRALTLDQGDVLRHRLNPARPSHDNCSQDVRAILLAAPRRPNHATTADIARWSRWRDWQSACHELGIPFVGGRRRS